RVAAAYAQVFVMETHLDEVKFAADNGAAFVCVEFIDLVHDEAPEAFEIREKNQLLPLERAVGERQHDVALGPEMLIERAHADTGRLADIGHGHPLEAKLHV